MDTASLSRYSPPVTLLIFSDAAASRVSQSIFTAAPLAPTIELFSVILSALIDELVLPEFKMLSDAAFSTTVSAVIWALAVSKVIFFDVPPAVIVTV